MLNKLILSEGHHPPEKLIVFFHGFMGDHRDFLPLAQSLKNQLADSSTLVLYDLPGHGQSQGVHWETLSQLVNYVVRDIRSYHADHVFCIGYSLGGRFLANLIASDPDLVNVAFFESSTFGLQSPSMRQQRLSADRMLLRPVIEKKQEFAAFLDRWYSMELFVGLKQCPTYNELISRRQQQNPVALQKSLDILSVGCMPYLADACAYGKTKLYYCAGEWDQKYSAIGRALPKKFIYNPVKGASHNVHFMQPKLFLNIVVSSLTC